jgi:PAS domain S-box-containing protein
MAGRGGAWPHPHTQMTDTKTVGIASGAGPPTFEVEESRQRASVLLVDDQPARLLTYEAMLSGLGLHCVRALSGAEALEKLLQQEFAVILLDVNMPEMDGFEVARLVREHPRMERTPIIFVTGVNVSEFDRLKGYEVGAIDYIAVPVVPEILRSKVALLVELHQRRSELKSLNRALHEARSQAEAQHATALAEQSAQLNAVFQHPDQITVILQAVRNEGGAIRDWIYRDANGRAQEFLGLSRDAVVGRLLSEIYGERAPRANAICTQVLGSQEPLRYEIRYRNIDLLITVFPGGRDLVISSAVDVTERKRAEALLRDAARRNRALLENAPMGVAHVTMDGRFEYANDALCQMLGYSMDELRTKTWQEVTHPDDVAEDELRGARVLAGEATHYILDKRYVRKDGSHVWVSMFGNFVRDDAGVPVQGIAIILDITARRRADEALRQSQERLLVAKRAAGLGIHDWNVSAGTIQWDERVYELWGIDPATPVTYEVFASALHPEDVQLSQQAVDRALDPSGEGHYACVYRVINRTDGLTRWVEAIGRVFFEDGRAVRLVGTVQDVTHQHQMQDALKQADRRKDEFLAMLAHELRNPVAPIRNAAEGLSRLVQAEQPRALVSMIQRQSAHLSRILDDLLDVARITQGRIELRREVTSVAKAIELAIDSVQPQIDAKRHRLTIERGPEPLHVHADKVRLEQCVTNLLTNAAKYTDEGGSIRIKSYAEAAFAVIEVADSGVGIAPEFVSRVFDLFAQSERSLDRSQGGLGIGLSTCKQLIEMHGGTITCNSPGVNQGATFTLRLPLFAAASEPATAAMGNGAAIERVLIVDDNRDAADSLAMCLRLDGHETLAVYTAEEALAQFARYAPDVVLLDIGLPLMDGYEVAERLRAQSSTLRLIALTGYGQEDDKRRALNAGFDAHLTKPMDLAALKHALRAARQASPTLES